MPKARQLANSCSVRNRANHMTQKNKIKLDYYTDRELAKAVREARPPRITGLTKIFQYVTQELGRKINRQRAGQMIEYHSNQPVKLYQMTEDEIKDLFVFG